jgi:hypothetical protein
MKTVDRILFAILVIIIAYEIFPFTDWRYWVVISIAGWLSSALFDKK